MMVTIYINNNGVCTMQAFIKVQCQKSTICYRGCNSLMIDTQQQFNQSIDKSNEKMAAFKGQGHVWNNNVTGVEIIKFLSLILKTNPHATARWCTLWWLLWVPFYEDVQLRSTMCSITGVMYFSNNTLEYTNCVLTVNNL